MGFDDANGLIDRRQQIVIELRTQPLECHAVGDRIELWAFAHRECNLLPQCMRHDQDIRKQNRRIEAETPYRLQRDLGCKFRIKDEIEKPAGFGTQRAIFRQVAPSLAHQPDRRGTLSRAIKHCEERIVHRMTL